MTTTHDTTYNGWKNRETWSVALNIGNIEYLYFAAVDYMKIPRSEPYKRFIEAYGTTNSDGLWATEEGYDWLDANLDYEALDELMDELND